MEGDGTKDVIVMVAWVMVAWEVVDGMIAIALAAATGTADLQSQETVAGAISHQIGFLSHRISSFIKQAVDN